MTFGLKSLLAAMGVLGVAAYLLFAAPEALATVALSAIWVLVCVLMAAGVIYGRGRTRAFCLGALFPAGGTVVALVFVLFAWLLAGPWEIEDLTALFDHLTRMAFTVRAWSAIAGVLTILAGAVSATARFLLAPKE